IETYNGFVNIPEDYLPDDANIYMEEELLKFAYGHRPLSEYDQFVETLNNTFGFAAYCDQAIETIAAVLGQ
ncbi:MAG TPA: ABC transporter substrate-binding protein, partial [Clostridia bacterium]|nr:ABC transporter substrate-binding protein [Clostridia bacterium]